MVLTVKLNPGEQLESLVIARNPNQDSKVSGTADMSLFMSNRAEAESIGPKVNQLN